MIARGTKVWTVEESMDVNGQISQALFSSTALRAVEGRSTRSNTYGLGGLAGESATEFLGGQRDIPAISHLPGAFGTITAKSLPQLSASKYAFHTC